MRQSLLILCLLTFTLLSFGQAASTDENQRLVIIEAQMQTIQKQLQDNSTKDLISQLEDLKNQRKAEKGINDSIESKIQILTTSLNAKEKIIADLQQNLSTLTSQLNSIVESNKTAQADKSKAEDLTKQAKEAKEKLTTIYTTNYKAYVTAWYDLGTTLAASTITSKTLLIFPNAKTEPIWQSITKYVGIAGGVIGPILYSSADNKSQQNAGIVTAGVSLSVTGLVTLIFKNKNNQRLLENIGRNVAFTDDVNSLNNIATQFKDQATNLFNDIKGNKDKTDWKPTIEQLKSYYSLISLRRDLTVAIRQLKAKAEFLLTQTSTDEGKAILNKQIVNYKDALTSWESSEATYLDTYQYLYSLTKEN